MYVKRVLLALYGLFLVTFRNHQHKLLILFNVAEYTYVRTYVGQKPPAIFFFNHSDINPSDFPFSVPFLSLSLSVDLIY